MSGLINKYATLNPIANEVKIREFTTELVRNLDMVKTAAIDDRETGIVLLQQFTIDGQPVYLEVIGSSAFADSASTLYGAHPVFNNKGAYIEARRELITVIEDMKDAVPGSLIVTCPMRKRPALIRELGLAQLVDLMRAVARRMSQ